MVVVHVDEIHAHGHSLEEEEIKHHAQDLVESVRSTGFNGEVQIVGLEEVFLSGGTEEKRDRLRRLMQVRLHWLSFDIDKHSYAIWHHCSLPPIHRLSISTLSPLPLSHSGLQRPDGPRGLAGAPAPAGSPRTRDDALVPKDRLGHHRIGPRGADHRRDLKGVGGRE